MRDERKGYETDEALLGRLDDALRERTAERSELPWLELSVTAEIEARERARRWLRDHGGFFGVAPESLRAMLGTDQRGVLAALGRAVVLAAGTLGGIRLWTLLGAIAAGATAGWLWGTYLPVPAAFDPAVLSRYTPATSMALLPTGIGAALGGLASQWHQMREYYS